MKFLLDTKRIDGAILSRREGLWNNQPMIATTFEDLLKCAGSSLSQSASVSSMGDLTTYASILGVFKESRRLDLTKLAVVGTPCQIQTIRKMHILSILPSHLVRFTIGLFCFENFLLNEIGRKYLEERIGTELDQIEKINLKDSFIVNLRSGKTVHVDLEEMGPLVRQGCLACTDFSNFSADVSVGGLGSPDGYTTTIVRNKMASSIVEEAISRGYLMEVKQRDMIKKIDEISRRKRSRGERIIKVRKRGS